MTAERDSDRLRAEARGRCRMVGHGGYTLRALALPPALRGLLHRTFPAAFSE